MGRLTNPTPAMWTHFESIHITMQPTYQSMYFPGQGLLLAAGKVLFGQSLVRRADGERADVRGALLDAAGMAAAATGRCWAGFMAVLRLGLFSYWTNTYHAGGLAGGSGRSAGAGRAAAADEDGALPLRHC